MAGEGFEKSAMPAFNLNPTAWTLDNKNSVAIAMNSIAWNCVVYHDTKGEITYHCHVSVKCYKGNRIEEFHTYQGEEVLQFIAWCLQIALQADGIEFSTEEE